MALVVNVIDDVVRSVVEEQYKNSSQLANAFPFGEVYVRMQEVQGMQWRILVRGKRADDIKSYFDALMPMNTDNVPACVKLVDICTK